MTTHTAAFPSVIAAVVSIAGSALPALRVIRGRDISNNPSDVVMVGVTDLENDAAGTFRQTMHTFGGNREEVGEVTGLVVAWNGDSDQDAACSTAFGYFASLETAVRADKTLGLTDFESMTAEMSAGDVLESQDDAGATTALSFTIAYKARI